MRASRGIVGPKAIRAYAGEIAREFRPRKIILFGSHAYGTPTPDSDVDLLIVLPFRGRACYKAIEILNRVDPPFPVDLIVRTPAKLRWRLSQNDWFLREIVERGRVLYEAPNA